MNKDRKMYKLYNLFIMLLLLLITQNTFSQIYKWTDKDGNIKFSDRKPQQAQKVKEVKLKINTVKVPKLHDDSTTQDYASTNNKIIMYSASWCGVCKTAKSYFNSKGIPYKEYDVETSVKGRKDFKRLGGRGVPLILIGKKRMDGFDRSFFDKLF